MIDLKRKQGMLGVLALTLMLCCCFTACSNGEGTAVPDGADTAPPVVTDTEPADADADDAADDAEPVFTGAYDTVDKTISFDGLLAETSAQRREARACETSFDEIFDYLVEDPEDATLLTDEECESILAKNPQKDSVSGAEAVADTDLLFRALRASYGAYYYFGAEKFDAARAEVMDWLEGQETVSCAELSGKLSEALDFVVDGHFHIGETNRRKEERWEYFYCPGEAYSEENGRYYALIEGERYYVDSFSDERIRVEPTLLESGEMVYAPVLFCPKAEMCDSEMTLVSESGETLKRPLVWTESSSYLNNWSCADVRFARENDVAYISVRSFGQEYKDTDMVDFIATAEKVKDASAIIFDIRSNGGGSDIFGDSWMHEFTGEQQARKGAVAHRTSNVGRILTNGMCDFGSDGSYILGENEGKSIRNDIPIIVLVDDCCASSGESMLKMLWTMDNVLVVGSNSGGLQLCGNCICGSLPNTGIATYFGVSLFFFDDMTSVDLKGYEPDVWCDPENALDAAINLLERCGKLDSESADVLAVQSSGRLSLRLPRSIELNPGTVISRPAGSYTFYVNLNSLPITEYSAVSSDPSVCTCEITETGALTVTCVGEGDCVITVTHGYITAQFRWQGTA